MAVSFKWNNKQKTLDRLTNSNSVGMKLASTCEKYMDPYVPMDTGMLAQNTLVEPNKVTYNQPYAHRQFNGDGFNFSRDKHQNATSHWDKAMQSARKNDIAKEMTEYIRRMG